MDVTTDLTTGRSSAFGTPALGSAPAWMDEWTRVSPHPTNLWAVSNGPRHGLLDPATGLVELRRGEHDRRLPGLAVTLAAGGELISYRPHRRAVVRHSDRFVKVVRPDRAPGVAHRHTTVATAAAATGGTFASPEVLAIHGDGRIELSVVAGNTLHDRIRRGFSPPIADLAALLRAIGSNDASGLPGATVDQPQRWIETVCRIEPELRPALTAAACDLPAVDVTGDAFVHSDLHDKNILVPARGPLGIIDVDGASRGAPEIDVANLAVHLELRALQGGRTSDAAATWSDALIRACARSTPIDLSLVHALQRHTWFRLTCLYRCRPGGRPLTPILFERATAHRR